MVHDTPAACFNCCSSGGGLYKPFEGATQWHMGLDSAGQAHYACAECSVLLFNARPIQTREQPEYVSNPIPKEKNNA